MTILDFLREHQHHCGTKEGCASGDCGACTVVMAELASDAEGGDTLRYKSVNSCITFLGALHGRQLITVENLQDKDTLHASQQAMVDCHGSQCGFCTPGIVMSMFAAMKSCNAMPLSRELVDEQLGGNLCRCTGYRPIIDATMRAMSAPIAPDHFDRESKNTIEALREINTTENDKSDEFFSRPQTIDELCLLKQSLPQAPLLGGGTDLALSVTQHLDSLENIIMLGDVSELACIDIAADTITVGACVSLSQFRDQIVQLCPSLEPLLIRFGGTQVRNQATVGGNFANASPVGDLPPVFIALNVSVVLQSSRGTRAVSAEDFFISYKNTLLERDEFIREFVIARAALDPAAAAGRTENRFYKISKRLDDDISAVCAAFHLEMEGDTIVRASSGFGGMAEIPKRAAALEAVLEGSVLDAECIENARVALRQDFQPIDDVRASAAYRAVVCENLLMRLATELYTPDVATTVTTHGS